MLAHWFGCFYFLLSESEGFQSDWSYPYPEGDFGTLTRKYLGSLYWSTLTLTTIGDLPTPETNAEWVASLIYFFFIVSLWSSRREYPSMNFVNTTVYNTKTHPLPNLKWNRSVKKKTKMPRENQWNSALFVCVNGAIRFAAVDRSRLLSFGSRPRKPQRPQRSAAVSSSNSHSAAAAGWPGHCSNVTRWNVCAGSGGRASSQGYGTSSNDDGLQALPRRGLKSRILHHSTNQGSDI